MKRVLERLVAMGGALAIAACGIVGDPAVEETVELATMGGQRSLRDPPRPIRGETRVLLFALDGVGWDDLRTAVISGGMPNLASLLGRETQDGGFERGHLVPMLTVLPSATTAAWASAFTGEPPASTGVPGNEWFDRSSMRFYAPVPITVESRAHAAKQYGDELMSELVRVPTLYERADLRAHVAFHPIYRGADLLTIPNFASFGDLTGALAKGVLTRGSPQTAKVFEETDLTNVNGAIAAIEDGGVPDLQVVYFPGIDLFTHREEDPIAGQQRYLSEVTDRAIGEVVETYRRMGVLESTFVVVLSDHGHIPRISDDAHSLHVDGEDEPTAAIAGAGFRLRPNELEPEATDYQAAVAFQGGMGYVYLADRSTCPAPGDRCDWSRPPRMEEDVLAVARSLHRAASEPARAGGLQGALDLILVRATGTSGDAPPFQVLDGDRVVPIGEYLAANPRPDLLELERRLEWLAVGPHGHLAGDILIMPHSSPELPVEARFYLGPPYWSEHGSAHGQDSRVPLLIARPGASATELRALVDGVLPAEPTQLDVTRLLLALLQDR